MLIPATRIEGKLFNGETHLDCLRQWVILHRLPPFLREHEDRWEHAMNWLDTNIKDWPEQEDGFLDTKTQEFLTRQTALAHLGPAAQANASRENRDWADASDLDFEHQTTQNTSP
jgi:hypothetical protein